MDAPTIVNRIRDHYVEQFRAFVDDQHRKCQQGASEVKLQLRKESGMFKGLYCVDFVSNGGQSRITELASENVPSFDPITAKYGQASLLIRHLRWDDVLLRHDIEVMPEADLDAWFQRWFDLEDARYEEGAEVSCVIHSLSVEPQLLSIDFGTAQPEAFWEMLELLENGGASSISVSSSRAEAE